MTGVRSLAVLFCALSLGSVAARADEAHDMGGRPLARLADGALLLDNLGEYHRGVGTSVPEAQQFFDQGLRMLYGFNHDEAARSFAKAGALDPRCAACFWGAAYALGPNYNVPFLPDRAAAAWESLQKALALAAGASPADRALIEALSRRYKGPEPVDPPTQQPFNVAFGEAMREVAARFPEDLDVQTLFAESLMNTNPWKLWTLEGKPSPGTEEIVATLERVLAKSPNHPGANHYYIHAVEASPHPEKAEAAADRVGAMMPGAGHLVHMPAHIYQRVGRYEEAVEVNRRASVSDDVYLGRARPSGYYSTMYSAHNHMFRAYSAAMAGRSAESIEAARASVRYIDEPMLTMMPGMDFYASESILALVRFGRWDELLAEPRPKAEYQVLTGLWLFGRGMAQAGKGRLDEAEAERAALLALMTRVGPDVAAGYNTAADVLAVAEKTLEGQIAWKRGRTGEAMAAFRDAVAREDQLAYNEPADWFYPLRHHLGWALLAQGQAAEAEGVYREDLRRNRENGWALFGLAKALRAQKKDAEAASVEARFAKAWAQADLTLAATAF